MRISINTALAGLGAAALFAAGAPAASASYLPLPIRPWPIHALCANGPQLTGYDLNTDTEALDGSCFTPGEQVPVIFWQDNPSYQQSIEWVTASSTGTFVAQVEYPWINNGYATEYVNAYDPVTGAYTGTVEINNPQYP